MYFPNILKIIPPKLLFISFLLTFIAAYFSIGYYNPDEHFQILEFANEKLHLSDKSCLPWEFHARMRPTLQPYLVVCFAKCLRVIGIVSPLTILWLLRLGAGCFTWWTYVKFTDYLVPNFKNLDTQRYFVYLILFLWFLPFLNVRFSSENLSGSCFLLGLYYLLTFLNKDTNSNYPLALAGFLFGLSFYFRFQIAFAFVGIAIGLIMSKQFRFKSIIMLIITGSLAIGIGSFLDYCFYGEWIFTPLNYFKANILEHKAASFGVQAWYYYFDMVFQKAVPPISIALLLLWALGLFKMPKSVFFYGTLLFVGIHFMVGHKELRFLFPLLYIYLYTVIVGLDACWKYAFFQKYQKYAFYVLCIVNIPALIFACLIPAEVSACYFEKVYSFSTKENIKHIVSIKENVFSLEGLEMNYYRPKGTIDEICHDAETLEAYLIAENIPKAILFCTQKEWKGKLEGYKAEKIYCILPDFLLDFNISGWQERSPIYSLYRLTKK